MRRLAKPVEAWQYKWLQTYWARIDLQHPYVGWRYEHRWTPGGEVEREWPDEDGLNALGAEGWELVEATAVNERLEVPPSRSNVITEYEDFTTYRLAFKRPRP